MPGLGSRDLRERAKHARRLALSTWDEVARDALDKYADELERQAEALDTDDDRAANSSGGRG